MGGLRMSILYRQRVLMEMVIEVHPPHPSHQLHQLLRELRDSRFGFISKLSNAMDSDPRMQYFLEKTKKLNIKDKRT